MKEKIKINELNPPKRYYLKSNCIDCGKLITNGYKRCHPCAGKLRKGKNHWHYKEKSKCIDCGKILSKRKYIRCAKCERRYRGKIWKENETLKGKNNHFFGKHHTKEFKIYQSKHMKQFLSNPKNHWNWQDGISFHPYPLGWNKTFKEQIRYRDSYRCQLCGKPEIEQGRRLSIHHIDYDKNNINPDNLISLCGSCHMKTNYNREYWKNKLRGKE